MAPLPPLIRAGAWRQWLDRHWMPHLLALFSGVLAGLASPGGGAPWVWVVAYVPLFVALERVLAVGQGRPVRLWMRGLLLCWLTGLGHSWGAGGWIVNTAHIYGHLPLPVAYAASLLGYGSLLGAETFFFLGVPFLLGWRYPRWGFLLVLFWSAAFQGIVPRFFFWTFGHLIHPQPFLVQVTDLVGSAGLNFWILSLHLVLFAWLRQSYAEPLVSRRALVAGSVGVAALFVAAAGYGVGREHNLAQAEKQGTPVNLGGVQPNFTLRRLASNPDLSFSDRRMSLDTLLRDTARVLEGLQQEPGVPTVVVWPESVFPLPYFQAQQVREAVEWWARVRNIHLVLATVMAEQEPPAEGREREYFGASVHVAPNGDPPEVYRKISLIPYGETIPFGDEFPAYRRLLKAWIPQISEFSPGREFTVFQIAPGVRVAPMICFDALRDGVARGMTRNGANLGLVLANLAWFGKTNASDSMEFSVRFRVLENRLPTLLLSQNGRSVMLNAAGYPAYPRTREFEVAHLPLRVRVPETFSFFSAYTGVVHGLYLAGTLLLCGWLFYLRGLAIFAAFSHRGQRPGPGKKRGRK